MNVVPHQIQFSRNYMDETANFGNQGYMRGKQLGEGKDCLSFDKFAAA